MNACGTFVLFSIGKRRFALPSACVAELARPAEVHTFPHTTPGLAGVLVRRGQVVPVCDVAEVLVGADAPARRFYLIATCRFGDAAELAAIPVSGECELVSAEVRPRTGKLPDYVVGLLSVADSELVEVVDLEQLISAAVLPASGKARVATGVRA